MPSPDNGVYIIVGEMSMVVTAMRRGSRWSSHGHQEEEQDSLMRNFSNLKDILNHLNDITDLSPTVYLSPFLDVIRSENTTGPVTGLALSAINKFLSYGLIDAKSITAAAAVENIADAVTHARFMGTDPASDEVVLMKILQVLRMLLLTPLGVLLTNESVCEIMQSCFRICFEIRLSELLRRSAEHALMDMVQLLFSCLPQFSEDSRCTYTTKLKMRASGMDTTRNRRKRSPRLKHKKINHSLKGEELCGLPTPPTSNVVTPEHLSEISTSIINANSSSHVVIPQELGVDEKVSEFVDVSKSKMSIQQVVGLPDSLPRVDQREHELPVMEPKSDCSSCETFSESVVITERSQIVDSDQVNMGLRISDTYALDLSYLRRNSNVSDGSATSPLEGQNKQLEVNERNSESCSVIADVTEELTTLVDTGDIDYVNPRGVRFTAHQPPKDGSGPLLPYGLPCVRELFRFLVSLINPLDRHNSDVMIHIGLSLLTVALESGADHIGKFNSFLVLIKDETCRNLFSLLSSERLTVFAATLRVYFLLFEALRTNLKFQLEMFLTRLMETVVSESPKISYEQREISLDCVTQLWHIPGLVTELYINYDCDLYCCNLFEDLTKQLSKNAFPLSGLYSVHLLSLDALLAVVDSIEAHCHYRMLSENQFIKEQDFSSLPNEHENAIENEDASKSILQQGASGYLLGQQLLSGEYGELNLYGLEIKQDKQGPHIKPNRMKISENIPSHEELMAIKHKKKILATGTEQFNNQPSKGIVFLQEHGLLKDALDPQEVASFLRDNPQLDKKMIGEYISNRKNLKVLESFVRSFNFEDTRIDEALRQYLETFRLPGEAPLISLLMEHFAEHWHKSNNEPFANSDAAFTLAYAVIMLNVDQHNYNVKKQNNPMTIEDFKKNLKNVNGGQDFEEEMLEEIYISIKNEEIVMPAEQTGLVRENYLWKVLLRRGNSKEGKFMHVPNGLFDHDLFSLIWGPTVAALSFIFDKSVDLSIIQKALSGFRKCAMISAHYGMSDVFDNLVISLCKFTALVTSTEAPIHLPVSFGSNVKAQMAAKAVFRLAHRHGDILREGWKNLLDCMLQLYKAKLLPKDLVEAEDFVSPNGIVSLIREDLPAIPRIESGLLSSFYSYITLTSDSPSQRGPTQEDEAAKQAAIDCILDCHTEQLITESKFLRLDSLQELVKAEDFVSPNGIVSLIREDLPAIPRIESGLLSSFYSYITLTSDSPSQRGPTQEDEAAKQAAIDCILDCHTEQLITESKFLRLDSLQELVKAEDFVSPNGIVSLIREDLPAIPRIESGLLSSFYSYITLTSDSPSQRGPTQEDEAAKQAAIDCILDCHTEQLITESKFLRLDSLQELVKTLIFACHGPESPISHGGSYDEDCAAFLLELLVKVVLLNRDRVASIWTGIRDHLFSLVMGAAASDHTYLLERGVVGILRIAIRLVRKEEMIPQVIQSLRILLFLKSPTLSYVSRQVAYAIHELLRANAANIHTCQDWSVIFSLMECVGAGAKPPRVLNSTSSEVLDSTADSGAQSDSELSTNRHGLDSELGSDRGYTSDSELYESQGGSPRHGVHQRLIPESVGSSGGWIMVSKDGEIETVQVRPLPINQFNIILHRELLPHDPYAFLKCCESLAFLVRDAAHITSENFESCVHCIRTFVEASTNGGYTSEKKTTKSKITKEKKWTKNLQKKKEDTKLKRVRPSSSYVGEGYDADDEDKMDDLSPAYQQLSMQLLDLMHTLHTRASSIYSTIERDSEEMPSTFNGNLWCSCWCPLLQGCIHLQQAMNNFLVLVTSNSNEDLSLGIARLCCDTRRPIRTSALTFLQRALLVHDLQTLSPAEWEACFNKVLFPLLAKLLENVNPNDPLGMEETRMRGATLLCKVFLQHLSPLLTLPTFMALWLTILDFMDKYMHADGSDLLNEAIPESLKNMLLVMDTAGIFHHPEERGNLQDCQMWHITWDRINAFLPGLKDEVFKPPPPLSVPFTGCSAGEEELEEMTVIESVSVEIDESDISKEILTGKVLESTSCYPSENKADPTQLSISEEAVPSTPVSVILHPPSLPLVYSSIQTPSLPNAHISASSVPLLLNPSVMSQAHMPIFTSQAPCNKSPSSR